MGKGFDRKLLQEKKVALYGIGKIQEDFEYIFDWINIEFYITDHCEKKTLHDKPVFQLSEIDSENLLVIICDKRSTTFHKLERKGFQYQESFVKVEDLFEMLDDSWNEPWDDKRLVIWGAGNTCKDLLWIMDDFQYHRSIEFFIDSNAKDNGYFCNTPVYHPDKVDWEGLEDILIIVANGGYEAIKADLIQKGMKEEVNFTDFYHFNLYIKRVRCKPSEMMKKTVYADPIDAPFCQEPFQTAFISDVLDCCCSSLIIAPIGVTYTDHLSKVWQSISAKIFRLSMINKTFCFCRWGVCKKIPSIPEKGKGRFDDNPFVDSYPKRLQINIDGSCNLHCASCRNGIEIAQGEMLKNHFMVADHLIKSGWLEQVDDVIIAGYGEVFYSKVYERLLENVNYLKRKRLTILTNLLLFNEEKWMKIEGNYEYIEFQVSIDAATKETYEKVRRGGKWELLQKKLELLSNLRQIGEVSKVQINMVIQKENYKELEAFVAMAEKYKFDRVLFQKMYDFGVITDRDEYTDMAMLNDNLMPNKELESILRRVSKNPMVTTEFFS